MIDINEIRKRTQQAAEAMKKTAEKGEELAERMAASSLEQETAPSAAGAEEPACAGGDRQVEILGQIFGADAMAQMAANEELLQKMVQDKVAEATASGAEVVMGQLLGEDMGILAAAGAVMVVPRKFRKKEEC